MRDIEYIDSPSNSIRMRGQLYRRVIAYIRVFGRLLSSDAFNALTLNRLKFNLPNDLRWFHNHINTRTTRVRDME